MPKTYTKNSKHLVYPSDWAKSDVCAASYNDFINVWPSQANALYLYHFWLREFVKLVTVTDLDAENLPKCH